MEEGPLSVLSRPLILLSVALFSFLFNFQATDIQAAKLPAAAANAQPGTDRKVLASNASGLYIYIAHPDLRKFVAAYHDALAKPSIDGAAVMMKWQQIEPQPGVYDWTTLDPWLLQTVVLHKKLSIGVIAGLFAPHWLYGPGYDVPENKFDYNRASAGASCTVMSQPSVWNAVYLQQYRRMLTALAQHLHAFRAPDAPSGAAYSAVKVVKLSGINNTSEELKVDDTKPDHGRCHQSDAAVIWAAAGFTPARLVAAFMTIAQETAATFPDKLLSVAIIHRHAFPAINNAGHIYSIVAIPDTLTTQILQVAVPRYGKRLLVQWNALWQGPPPPEVAAAGREGALIGWQMNGFMGPWAGSGCIYPGWKIEGCRTPADFQSILENGINLGGQYIEVQVGSALNPRWAIPFQQAHYRLFNAN